MRDLPGKGWPGQGKGCRVTADTKEILTSRDLALSGNFSPAGTATGALAGVEDMAEDQGADEETEVGEDDELEDGGGSKKLSGKRLILFILLPIVLLSGIGAAAFFTGLADPLLGKEAVDVDDLRGAALGPHLVG